MNLTTTSEGQGKFRISATNMKNAPYHAIYDDEGYRIWLTRDDRHSSAAADRWNIKAPDFIMEADPKRGEVAAMEKHQRLVEIENLARARLAELLKKAPVLQRHTTAHGIMYHFEDDRYAGTLTAIYPGTQCPPYYATIAGLHPKGYSYTIWKWHQNHRRYGEESFQSAWDTFVFDTYNEAVEQAEDLLIVLLAQEKADRNAKMSFPNLVGQLNLELTNVLNAAEYKKHRYVKEVADYHCAMPINSRCSVPEYSLLIALAAKNSSYFPKDTQDLLWKWIGKASELMHSEVV